MICPFGPPIFDVSALEQESDMVEKIVTFPKEGTEQEIRNMHSQEANLAIVAQANDWLTQKADSIDVLHRSVHTSGGLLVITVWYNDR